jgi:signal transduction histidine kinase
MRGLIFQLRPDALREGGLVAAIRKQAASLADREGLEIHVHAPVEPLPLDEGTEAELFRVIQEAVSNSVKHASPGHIEIRLDGYADAAGTLVVEVVNDGVGFDPGVVYPGHLGLQTMRERTERLGGRLTIDSSPSGPTMVRVVLPHVLQPRTAPTPPRGDGHVEPHRPSQ